jgi:hypothetical protein
MLRFCEGLVPCTEEKTAEHPMGIKRAAKFYTVTGAKTANEPKVLPLCDLCPEAMRRRGYRVDEIEN